MIHRPLSVALSATGLITALSFAACGSYDDKEATTNTSATSTTTTGAGTTTGQTMTATASSTTGTATTGGSTANNTSSTTGDASTTGGGGATSTTEGTSTSTTGAIEASCDNVTPCGGDILGTWAVAGSCFTVTEIMDMSGFGLGCTEAPVEGQFEVSGSLTAGDDGTLTDETLMTGMTIVELPAECLNVSGTITTCDRVGSPIQQSLGYKLTECVENTETMGCTCTSTIEQEGGIAYMSLDHSKSPSYTAADMKLTTTTFGVNTEYAYCVEDTVLTLSPTTVNKMGTVTGTVALIKQ